MPEFYESIRIAFTVIGLCALAVAGFHFLLYRALAPQRIIERRTPCDIGLSFQEVRIPTANGLSMFGWFVPAASMDRAPTVTLLHGWSGNAETLLPLARPLHDAGFALLLFAVRCHGRSDEDRFVSLPRFAEDLEHAIAWLRKQPTVDPAWAAVVGHSVGAGAALLVASRRNDIGAVASIAAFAHPASIMRRWMAGKRIPYFPIGWYIVRYVEHVTGHRFDDIAPITIIGRVRCPTLLVHGAEDTTVPVTEAHAIHAVRGGDNVRLKIILGSHDDYGDIERELGTLVTFLRDSVTTMCPTH